MSEDGEWSEIVEMIRRAHDPESQAVASSDSSVHAHVVGSGLDSVFKTHDNLFRAARTILDLVGHQIIYRGSIARSIFSKARAIVDCASKLNADKRECAFIAERCADVVRDLFSPMGTNEALIDDETVTATAIGDVDRALYAIRGLFEEEAKKLSAPFTHYRVRLDLKDEIKRLYRRLGVAMRALPVTRKLPNRWLDHWVADVSITDDLNRTSPGHVEDWLAGLSSESDNSFKRNFKKQDDHRWQIPTIAQTFTTPVRAADDHPATSDQRHAADARSLMHASSKTGSPPSSSQPPVDSLQHLSPRFSATALQPESSLNQLDVKDLSNMVHLESDDINIIVAKGSFGEVRRGILQRGEGRTTTLQVALKALVLRTPLQSDGQVRLTKRFRRETSIWSKLQHPNILPFLGTADIAVLLSTCLISPWIFNGNCMEYLKGRAAFDCTDLIRGIANGLHYLHSRSPPVIHGDLRAANVLIDDTGCPLLCDFGLAVILEDLESLPVSTTLREAGNPRWMSPELFIGDATVSMKSDVWSFGMVMLEVFTLKPPFPDLKKSGQVILALHAGTRPTRPSEGAAAERGMTDRRWQLMLACWALSPSNRPPISSVFRYLDE